MYYIFGILNLILGLTFSIFLFFFPILGTFGLVFALGGPHVISSLVIAEKNPENKGKVGGIINLSIAIYNTMQVLIAPLGIYFSSKIDSLGWNYYFYTLIFTFMILISLVYPSYVSDKKRVKLD